MSADPGCATLGADWSEVDFTQNLEEATDAIRWDGHSLESEGSAANADVNFRLPCTIELQPLSLTPIKMRKVELSIHDALHQNL